ncbi:hypothetical protein C8A03DRAFT_39103 [Achaetomium macrosporum]|uniref:Uncharacterized protein n=1 Tax=Achaetomium macrosporum TaxID=79813 RepID=A0AAN7H6N8_9PEZI|nr:hypothetical protein C8A03DRAFT_39103 [Achaetomium macrosporum]
MAGRGRSSASTQVRWEDVGNNIKAAGELTSSTFIRTDDWYKSPSWQELFDYGREFYGHVTTRFGDELLTHPTDGQPGSRLVATLCFAYQDESDYSRHFMIFQSTIPRGVWRAYMLENGERKAPKWWREAMVRPPPSGSRKVALHAEDSAIFLCNSRVPDFDWEIEEPRLIVFGHIGNTLPGHVYLCSSPSRKNPDCQEVARRMNIKFPRNSIEAKLMGIKEEDPSASGGGSHNHSTTEDELRDERGNSGGISGNTQFSSGSHGSHGYALNQASIRAAGHQDLSSLTKGMSTLRVSGSGNGNGSNGSSHQKTQGRTSAQSSKAPHASKTRPSTTSQARSSTKPSAPRTSAERLASASRSSAKYH